MVRVIIRELQPGEAVELDMLPSPWWTSPRYVFTLGLWEVWRRRHHFLLTNQRVIEVKGLIAKSERAVPIARIQDLNLRTSPLSGGTVALNNSAGGSMSLEVISNLTQADARKFADRLSRRVQEQSGTGL